MHKVIFILVASMLPLFSMGQLSASDCEGATVLCGDVYSEENAPPTTGNVYEYTGACNQNLETMSLWYTFTVYENGALSFVLTPNDLTDDYDWGLFNISNGGCEGITPGGSSPEVSCNSWGSLAVPNGATGISTANGGISNVGGPGDQFGPPFNANLPVLTGQTYALVVMNWSNSPYGYTIDFGESTASLYDQEPPTPAALTSDCSQAHFLLTFSEVVVSSSADDLDFLLNGPQGDIQINNVLPVNPNGLLEDQFILIPDDQITTAGIYTLTITDISGSVVDPCGNATIGEISIEIINPLQFQSTVLTACNGVNGSIEITDVTGGTGGYEFLLNNELQSDFLAESLNAGNYFVTIEDSENCNITYQIIVPDNAINVTISEQDTISCAQPFVEIVGVEITPAQSVFYAWDFLTNEGFVPTNETSINPQFSQPGVYQLTISNSINGCTAQSITSLIASELNDLAFETNVEFACNGVGGSIEILNASGGLEPYSIFLNSVEQNSNQIYELADGFYTLMLIDVNDCMISQEIEVPLNTISVSIETQDTLACNLPIVTISGVLITPEQDVNYYWEVLTDDGYVATGDEIISPSYNVADTYQLTITNPVSGCAASAEVDLISNVPSNFSFEYITSNACNGIGGSIEITSILEGESPFNIILENVSQNSQLIDPIDAGNYTLTIQDANFCETTLNITVDDNVLLIQIPTQEALTCDISEITIEGLDVQPTQNVEYTWAVQTSNGFVSTGDTGASPQFDSPGIYQVTATALSGACSAETTIEIFYSNENNLDFDIATFTACNGANGQIEIQNISGGTSPFEFSVNNEIQISLQATGLADGTYQVTITDAHNCVLSEQATVQDQLINVFVPEQDKITCSFPTILVQGVEVTPDQNVNYSWSYFSDNAFETTGASGIAPSFSATGAYQLTITNEQNGCEASTTFIIESGDLVEVDLTHMKFPNIFTPNKDSKNEDWVPFLVYDPSFNLTEVFDVYKLKIFNRWGNLIFESDGSNSRRWSVNEEETGTYFYTLVYSTTCGGIQSGNREGTIQLLR